MGESPEDKRYEELDKEMVSSYVLILTVLTMLPIPVKLPEMEPGWDAVIALPTMDRCRRELILDQPIDDVTKRLVQRILLDWLSLYEIAGTAHVLGFAPWRLDGMEAIIRGIVVNADQIAGRLQIDLEPPESV